jgi:hypothetical protein
MPNYQQMAYRREVASTVTGTALETATTGLSTGLFIAAAASNAVPLGGQIAAGVLAVAGALTKLFAGKRMEKKAAKQEQQIAMRLGQRSAYRQQGLGLGQATQVGGNRGQLSEEQRFAHHQPTTDWAQVQPSTAYGYMRNRGNG